MLLYPLALLILVLLVLVFRSARHESGIASALLSGAVFLVVFAATAVVLTRLIGGPGAPDGCAGDECDGNMAYVFPFLFIGLPVGIAAGWFAARSARRLAFSRRSART
jgi:hypothetical protein